jgi:hypothetical protein
MIIIIIIKYFVRMFKYYTLGTKADFFQVSSAQTVLTSSQPLTNFLWKIGGCKTACKKEGGT